MRLCLTLLALLATTAVGSAQTIRIAPPTEIARAAGPQRFSEPHLAVHPSRPTHLLATAFIASNAGSFEEMTAAQRCATFVTLDGGHTWARHDFAITQCYDEQVAIAPDGQAVFMALAHLPGLNPDRNDWLVAFHSSDGGVTWDDAPTTLGWRFDHPALTVDRSASARRGWFYLTAHLEWGDGTAQRKSAVVVSRSRDGGKTFDVPSMLTPSTAHNSAEMPVVLSDGTLVVSFVEDTWAKPGLERRPAWVASSTDGGVTFAPPQLAYDQCGPPPGFQLSALAVDPSAGPSKDRLYFACRQSGGGPIVVTTSADGGHVWSRPGVAAGPGAIDRDARRVASIAVNDAGVLGVLSVERRPNGGDSCLVVLVSTSLDQGKSFVAPVTVSQSRCGQTEADQIAARRHPTYGDYFGFAATPDGRFHAVWSEVRDGASVLLTTVIEIAGRMAMETSTGRPPTVGRRDR